MATGLRDVLSSGLNLSEGRVKLTACRILEARLGESIDTFLDVNHLINKLQHSFLLCLILSKIRWKSDNTPSTSTSCNMCRLVSAVFPLTELCCDSLIRWLTSRKVSIHSPRLASKILYDTHVTLIGLYDTGALLSPGAPGLRIGHIILSFQILGHLDVSNSNWKIVARPARS